MNYSKVIGLALIISIACITSFAQSNSPEVVATSGNSWQNQNTRLSWTFGESFITTLATDQNMLTQGFHQHDLLLTFPLLGDANCNGIVDVLDVITMINYILENEPNPFCFENADTNFDGHVDVLDAIATINIILAGEKEIHPKAEYNRQVKLTPLN